MRWLGSAVRAQEIAVAHANTRTAFGKTLGEHQGVSFMLADNAIDIQTARLLIQRTAWLLDQGERASAESSLAKVYCSEAVFRVADRIEDAARLLEQHDLVDQVTIVKGTVETRLKPDVQDYSPLPKLLIDAGLHLTLFREEEVNLETAFLALTKGLVQ